MLPLLSCSSLESNGDCGTYWRVCPSLGLAVGSERLEVPKKWQRRVLTVELLISFRIAEVVLTVVEQFFEPLVLWGTNAGPV